MPTLNVSDETLAAIRESLVAEMERVKQDATKQIESYERTLAEISDKPKAHAGQVKRRRGRPKKDAPDVDTGAADSRLAPAGGSVDSD